MTDCSAEKSGHTLTIAQLTHAASALACAVRSSACSLATAVAVADARHTFATTKRQNKVSKESVLCGSDNIGVKGKTIIEAGAVIRGDLSTIELGSYCLIGRHAVIRPAEQKFQGRIAYIPMTIGDHVMIEENAIVEAAAIGDCTHIGKNVQVVRAKRERDGGRLHAIHSCCAQSPSERSQCSIDCCCCCHVSLSCSDRLPVIAACAPLWLRVRAALCLRAAVCWTARFCPPTA